MPCSSHLPLSPNFNSPAHISSNWPTCYKHKNSKYTNPVDTDSDRDNCSDGSQSLEEGDRGGEEGDREKEEGRGWEDGLDVGFEDV